jgi:RimJ/RimL family protein N-acetyltransferase
MMLKSSASRNPLVQRVEKVAVKDETGRMRMAATRKFPVLTTTRLALRAPLAKDVAALQAMFSIPEVTRFNNWPDAPAKAQVERSLRWMSKIFASGKGCAWIIEDRKSKALAGSVRFNSFDKNGGTARSATSCIRISGEKA